MGSFVHKIIIIQCLLAVPHAQEHFPTIFLWVYFFLNIEFIQKLIVDSLMKDYLFPASDKLNKFFIKLFIFRQNY